MRTASGSRGQTKQRRDAGKPALLLAAAVEDHRGGRLTQAAAIYRRVLKLQPQHPDALHLLALVEHAQGRDAEALRLVEDAIAAAGNVAAFHVAHGTILAALGRNQAAADALERALAIAPGHAEAWNALGNVRQATGGMTAAESAYQQALALRPDYPEALSNLGSALRALDRLADAAAALHQAIALRPGYANALANLGLVLQEQGRWAEALDAYDRALAADPDHPAAHGNRGMLLLLLGRLEEGFAEYEWRWRMPGFATPRRAFVQPPWDGEARCGETIFIHAEQGLGSAIQFVRYAPLAAARGAGVILECQPPLLQLFRQSLAGPDGHIAHVIAKGEPPPAFDRPAFHRQAPLMSLPHLLGTSLATIPATIPYLRTCDRAIADWQGRLAQAMRPRIGLVWAGNRRHENDRNRSMPPAALAPLVAGCDASFFSLQIPASEDDLAALGAGRVTDLAAHLPDFAATAAALHALDLVIAVDTAVVHLAGALGRPAWLLLPFIPEWRWLLDRSDSPWYPSLRLFRQTSPGDWSGLIAGVTAALHQWKAP